MGVETIKTLSEIPVDILENLMGKNGCKLRRRSNCIDNSPVIPYSEEVSISKEQTFLVDTIDLNAMEAILVRMTKALPITRARGTVWRVASHSNCSISIFKLSPSKKPIPTRIPIMSRLPP